MAIVADTHAIVWYLVEPERLSQVALDALEGSIAAGSPVYISAISLIEICYLTQVASYGDRAKALTTPARYSDCSISCLH
jgi:PIN domain nuclease of toxin-antitoxin system